MAALADVVPLTIAAFDAKEKSGTLVPDFVIGGLKKPSEWGCVSSGDGTEALR